MQAVAKAIARQSFAVTIGTGSGKSLCFFIPIIDAAIRGRAASEERRTRAIVIYPAILLTNFMMLELLMTRQSRLDQTVIENAQGLEFIVLDELLPPADNTQ